MVDFQPTRSEGIVSSVYIRLHTASINAQLHIAKNEKVADFAVNHYLGDALYARMNYIHSIKHT